MMPAASNCALELRDVSVRFGGVAALTDVSLKITAEAGISAIIGPNGAGKTTLFNVLTGLVRPVAGRVLVAGREVTGRRSDEIFRSRVSRTFQGVRLFEHLAVHDNVRLAARSACVAGGPGGRSVWFDRRKDADACMRRALDDVELDIAVWSSLPERLTLLERRQVEIARALTADPIAMLLDEPAAGLNTAEKEWLSGLLRRVAQARGCRVVIVEHDMKLVMAMAERISVMNFGRLLCEGRPDEIRRNEAVIEAYLGTGGHV